MHTVYLTTNLLNGKFYVGYHKTDCPNDRYLGSGVYIQRAIRVYGRQAFRKKVLFCFDDESAALLKEVEVIQSFRGNPLCMNYSSTGREGGMPEDFGKRISMAKLGKKRPPHVGLAVAEANRKRVGWHHSEEVRRRISESNVRAEPSRIRNPWNKGKHWTGEIRDRLSAAASQRTGNRNGAFGKTCIHNPETKQRKRVLPEYLNAWLSQGWSLGFSMKHPD